MDMPRNNLDNATSPPAIEGSEWICRLTDCRGRSRQHLSVPEHRRLVRAVDDLAANKNLQVTDLVTADRGLPNRRFLELFLDACLRPDCAGRYPLALSRIGLKNYSLFRRLYTAAERRQCVDFVIAGMERIMREEGDLLVQVSEDQFYVLSFDTTISDVTKMVDDLHKSLLGLTIPYPRRQVFSEVNLAAGIAVFNHIQGIHRYDTFFELADQAYSSDTDSRRPQVLAYHQHTRTD